MTGIPRTIRVNVVAAPSSTPAWLTTAISQGKSVNQWFQIPGTNNSAAPPTRTITADGTQGLFASPEYRVTAWVGAALKRTGSVLLNFGGGHGNYAGNEVTTLNLRADSPAWTEKHPGSAQNQAINTAAVYLDYRAASRHTYNGMHFIEQDNRLALIPKANPMVANELNTRTAANAAFVTAHPAERLMPSFDYSANEWDRTTIQNTGTTYYAAYPTGWFTESEYMGCQDHSTGDLYSTVNNGSGYRIIAKWTRATNSWATLTTVGSDRYDYVASVIDPTRGRMLVCGDNGAGTLAPRVYNTTTGAEIACMFSGLASALTGTYFSSNSMVYDSVRDRILLIKNSSPWTGFTITPTGATSYAVAALSMSTPPPTAKPQGMYNSTQYVPELDGLVSIRSYTENCWYMRLS